jgi:putative chitinase
MARQRITPQLLRAVGASKANAAIYAPLLDSAVLVPGDDWNSITSGSGVFMLVSQISVESGAFSATEEDLNYTVESLQTGNRRKYFTAEQARQYGAVKNDRNETIRRADVRMIGNLYYGTRNGNRPGTDDGYNLRGGGLLQTTGRNNWKAFADSVGLTIEAAAAWARQPDGAVASALFYWRNRKGLILAASRGDVTLCTQLITGGDHGLTNRIQLFRAAKAAGQA